MNEIVCSEKLSKSLKVVLQGIDDTLELEGLIKTSFRDIEILTENGKEDLNYILARFSDKKVKLTIEVKEE